jgi:single-stranded-DNA-specific exonuclease
MLEKVWTYKDFDAQEVDRLAKGAGISSLLAKVFVSRGITSLGTVSAGMSGIEYVRDFLRPDISRLHHPFLMDGMKQAVSRIIQAIEGSQEILVYGDYDVDGVSATSILYNFLSSRGANISYFIPDRIEDGYGLTMQSAQRVVTIRPSLVITVDCGITSVEEVGFLMESGIDVVVTDHHECKEILPEAVAVLNPHKPGCGYPFKELCGAGVAFKLVQGICITEGHDRCEDYLKYIDLAGLATIADIVPLEDENRIIASLGLKEMETTRNLGMNALIKAAGYGDKEISSYSAAFGLAPRVNAAGRLGDSQRGVRLFTTNDRVLAEALAKELDDENKQRQETESLILEDAVSYVESNLNPDKEKVLVIFGEGWHQGVIGIVASKITQRYNRPSIVIAIDDEGNGKGSARSIKGFNLFMALSACEDLLDRFGGHEMAAGISIHSSRIEELRKRTNEYADNILTDADMLPYLKLDAFVQRGEITLDSVREIADMAPFGEANPSPRFGYMALGIADMKTLSGGKHLKLMLRDASFCIEAIGFNLGELAQQYSVGDAIDVAFTPDINVWNGAEKLQLNIKDIKPCIFTNLDKNIVFNISNDYNSIIMRQVSSMKSQYGLGPSVLVPDRNELEMVYKYVRYRAKTAGGEFGIDDLYELSAQLSENCSIEMNFFKLKRAFEIFEELGLLDITNVGHKSLAIIAVKGAEKVELESSRIYTELRAANTNCYKK